MKKFGILFLVLISLLRSGYAEEGMQQRINRNQNRSQVAPLEKKLFTATLKDRFPLNSRAFHIILQAPEIPYTPGSVIAIYPENPKEKVDAILKILGDETLREYLTKEVDLDRVPEGMARAPDLLSSLEKSPLRASELPKLLPLRHRYYSIASSKETTPGEIHLTVVTFITEKNGHQAPGLCSNFLCREISLGKKLTCHIPDKKKFSPPEDPIPPVIMISSGAAIAPFRGFMQERSTIPSKNWLIHGGRTKKDDFYYKEEWQKLIASGHLKITTAFSRDQEEKIYVQDKSKEEAEEFLKWIDDGAIIYICGNSKKMVEDVTASLADILGGEEHIDVLRKSKRLFPQ